MIHTFNQLLVNLAGQLSEDMVNQLKELCSKENNVEYKIREIENLQKRILNTKSDVVETLEFLKQLSASYSEIKRIRTKKGKSGCFYGLGFQTTYSGFVEINNITFSLPNKEFLRSREDDTPCDIYNYVSHAIRCMKAFKRYLDREYSILENKFRIFKNCENSFTDKIEAFNAAFKDVNFSVIESFKFPYYWNGN